MRIVLLAAFLSVGNAVAAPFAVQLGEARIGLDAPPGFADTGFTGSPRLQELAEALTSASNRILLFAISDDDLRRFMLGDRPELRRYMLAVTPKGLERDRVSAGAFAGFAAESLRELGNPPTGEDFVKYLDSQPQGKASLLVELRKGSEVVSVLQGTRLPSPGGRMQQEKPQYLLSTTTLMLVRGKALSLAVYTGYDSPADLDWIRSITARWIEDLQRLNKR
jgi:hypothetical protein